MIRYAKAGTNSYGLTPAHIEACFPECRICNVAALTHNKTHVSRGANELVASSTGETWYLDDVDYSIKCGFTDARYARVFIDKATGFIVTMYSKSLLASELRKHIEELVLFVATSQQGYRRLKTIYCDKFSSNLDGQFVASICAQYGVALIVSPPYMPDKHASVANAHHRLQ